MPEQHECDYGLRICMDPGYSPYLEIDCACGCGKTLSPREARDRLNEYETLKAELEKWRRWIPDDEDLRDMQEQARARDGTYTNGLAAQAVYIGGLESRQHQLEAELETLKKATEALSAERAGKMADEMESGRRISTSRHIRELRAYIDILEGKDK